MKATLLFLAKFVCLTAPMIWIWMIGGMNVYDAFYSPIADAIYHWLGFEGIKTPVRSRYINFIPFLALMILTPKLSTRRRVLGTVIGLLILFAMHIAVNLAANPHTLRLPRRVSLALDAAPFVLWVIIANDFVLSFVREKTALATARKTTRNEKPDEGEPR